MRAAVLLVRPVRREVEVFRFSPFRLDVRDNSPRVNGALAALWRARNSGDPPSPPSPEGGTWLQNELGRDRKSTRLNSSHGYISYAVFCLEKKKQSQRSIYTGGIAHHDS